MINNISNKIVKARKQYRCNYSGKIINIGDSYERQVNIYDGEIYTFRTCEKALYLIEKLDMYGRGTDDDGFTDSDYDEMLDDYISNNTLTDEYANYLGSATDFVYDYLKTKEEV